MKRKPQPTGLDTSDRKRYIREYQARRRGHTSYKSLAEDASVLCALAAGEVTTSAAAKVLGVDLVSVREKVQEFVRIGVERVGQQLAGRIEELQTELAALKASPESRPGSGE